MTLDEVEKRLGIAVYAAYSAEELRQLLQAWR
jgi:predicted HTH domain antitoxin